MQLLKSLIILIVGFVLLIKGADFFVEGSSAVAKRLRIPSMIIGMTIVAMGTSLPECAVSVTASLTGNNSLAISNAVGSNLFRLPFRKVLYRKNSHYLSSVQDFYCCLDIWV